MDVLPTLVLPFDTSILTGQIKESSRKRFGDDIAAYLANAKTAEEALRPSMLSWWRTYVRSQYAVLKDSGAMPNFPIFLNF
jgi:hypothetical protein